MATKKTATPVATATRKPITLDAATALCPNEIQAEKMASAFGLDPVAGDDIFNVTRESLVTAAAALQEHLNEKAMAMHLQRIVGAYVGSAHGAGSYWSSRVTAARDLTAKAASDARDEDRDAPVGFASRAENARLFAGQTGLQAFAILAAAQGAVSAFQHLTGEDWKPYQRDDAPSLDRKAADIELEALA